MGVFNNQVSRLKVSLKGTINARVNAEDYLHFADTISNLTDRQRQYVNRIFSIVAAGDFEAMTPAFAALETEVRNECLQDELPIILSSLSVARSSTQYWHDNYAKWATEFGPQSISGGKIGSLPIDWTVVGLADLGAAVTVGTTISVVLVVPFVGWTFWGIVVGGAALIVSGGTVIIYVAS